MVWVSQNWIWVALGVGIALYLFRGRLGGHAGGQGGGFGGVLGGMGHEGHAGGGGHVGPGEQPDGSTTSNAPEAAVDPVGGEAVRTAAALTCLYQEKIYYFASKENRDRFEAAPQEFAQKAAGYPVHSAETSTQRAHRGC